MKATKKKIFRATISPTLDMARGELVDNKYSENVSQRNAL